MGKASKSGNSVNSKDVPVILAMIARGDRKHDVAAWFGLNQGRVAEVEDGKHGTPPLAQAEDLPPSGSPGPKARAFRATVEQIYRSLKTDEQTAGHAARLEKARFDFDKNE